MKKVILVGAMMSGLIAFRSYGQNLNPSIQNGQSVYETYCLSCHQQDGNGVEGVFPSLIKTSSLANKNLLVKVILQGQRGQIVVKGVTYNGEMAPIGITDKEVADVINYIRNSWGNKALLIKTSDVALAKKARLKDFQPY